MTKIRTCAPGQLEAPPRHPCQNCAASTFLHASIWKKEGEETQQMNIWGDAFMNSIKTRRRYEQNQNKTRFLGDEAP
jgi:hypothetical protein